MPVFLGTPGFDIDPMAKHVHDIKGVEFAIVFDIARSQKIGLVNIVNIKGFGKIRILNSFGNI